VCKEVRVQRTASPETSIEAPAESLGRLADLALVRIAVAARGIARGEVVADLASLANPHAPASRLRGTVDQAIEALACAGLVAVAPAGLQATEAGRAAAAAFLGAAGDLPRSWSQVRDVWLIAKALGWQRAPSRRTTGLDTSEGLRAAILAHAYGLQIKGTVTPAQLRRALAEAALDSAFGEGAAWLAGKLRLSARAGRLIAAQLLAKPRDLATDGQLVAALAAERVGATAADPASLRRAILRRLAGASERPRRGKRAPRRLQPARAKAHPSHPPQEVPPVPSRPVEAAPPIAPPMPVPALEMRTSETPPPVAEAPPPAEAAVPLLDLPGFAMEVRRCAAGEAQGWSGDRKAYISHVWRSMRATRPEWGLSEYEFKLLLAEAHRSGQLALANADLKDQSNIKDVQESAVVYRNAVFHFIRVDA
jgi:hypothetical protein